MSGLLLLGVLATWFIISVFLVAFITKRLSGRWWANLLRVLIFIILLVLPLGDEIIGGYQFRELCREEAVVEVDREQATGKTVFLANSEYQRVPDTWVPVNRQRWRYLDAHTQKVLVSFSVLQAKGGLLIRSLGISETNAPLTFKGYCAPLNETSIFRELNIKKINKSELQRKEQ
jgi:hypothetical protein